MPAILLLLLLRNASRPADHPDKDKPYWCCPPQKEPWMGRHALLCTFLTVFVVFGLCTLTGYLMYKFH